MERVTDRNFCTTFEAVFATAGTDKHGDYIPASEIESFEKQIQQNPDTRVITYQHQKDTQIGEITDVWTEVDENDNLKLIGRIGIFEENKEVVSEIKEGILNGLSISAHFHPSGNEELWKNNDVDVALSIDAEERKYIQTYLYEIDVPYRVQIEKSVSGGAVVEFLIENQEHLKEVAKAVLCWYFGRKSAGAEVDLLNIDFEVNVEFGFDLDLLVKNTKERIIEEYDETDELSQKEVKQEIEREWEKIEKKKD